MHFTYQWERNDGDIAGASGTADITSPGQITETYAPVTGDIGHTIRLRANDGTTTYYSAWSASIVAAENPTPPPGGGTILYTLDYDTGDWNQWGGSGHLQLAPNATADLQQSVRRINSGYAAKFHIPTYDGSNRGRCQIYLNGNTDYGNNGQEEWYGFSFMIEPGSQISHGQWNNLFSWHHRSSANPCSAPMHFAIDNATGTPDLYLAAWGGTIDFSTCNQPPGYRRLFEHLVTIVPGTWYDIVHRVKWSPSNTIGFVQSWINNALVIPYTLCATQYVNDGIYLKEGFDSGNSPGPVTAYEDCTVIASNYTGAISRFPAGSWSVTPPT